MHELIYFSAVCSQWIMLHKGRVSLHELANSCHIVSRQQLIVAHGSIVQPSHETLARPESGTSDPHADLGPYADGVITRQFYGSGA